MASKAFAVWTGSLKEGKGTISTATGVLNNANYSFATRFEGANTGTTPEEMIAAAHASCFSMALGAQLGGAGLTPANIETQAAVTLAKVDGGFQGYEDRADHDGDRSRCDEGSVRQGGGGRQDRLPDFKAVRQQHRGDARRQAGVGAAKVSPDLGSHLAAAAGWRRDGISISGALVSGRDAGLGAGDRMRGVWERLWRLQFDTLWRLCETQRCCLLGGSRLSARMCRSGGIGRRAWFRSMYSQGCGGSSPFFGTNLIRQSPQVVEKTDKLKQMMGLSER